MKYIIWYENAWEGKDVYNCDGDTVKKVIFADFHVLGYSTKLKSQKIKEFSLYTKLKSCENFFTMSKKFIFSHSEPSIKLNSQKVAFLVCPARFNFQHTLEKKQKIRKIVFLIKLVPAKIDILSNF